ncbi:hypothetical protein [Colwellia sp. 12G3]|uniref:hypothetical protein n=1 Tax=Colwellia sp. 12G3 TaxID=2058299 RepID=UPI000C34BC94|nr:hypothetical protein [Colwellia sp. 12G3]PKI12742.1 hypothetical protein CXF71_18580 [Colwellia sp. 12G3]
MQEDTGFTVYIGAAKSCNKQVTEDVLKSCDQLTTLNVNGGKLILVEEDELNFHSAVYVIKVEADDIVITRDDDAFKVSLLNKEQLSELLYALTSSWFLANLVGHDYADYVSCLKMSSSLNLDIIDINNADDLSAFLSAKVPSKPLTAITCNIEAVDSNLTLEWLEKIGRALKPFVGDETFFVGSMSSKSIQQSKSKIYLTRFYK